MSRRSCFMLIYVQDSRQATKNTTCFFRRVNKVPMRSGVVHPTCSVNLLEALCWLNARLYFRPSSIIYYFMYIKFVNIITVSNSHNIHSFQYYLQIISIIIINIIVGNITIIIITLSLSIISSSIWIIIIISIFIT